MKLIKELLALNEGSIDPKILAAGKKAFKAFEKARDNQDITSFEEFYGAIDNADDSFGQIEKIQYDPKTEDFYIEYEWTLTFDDEEQGQTDTATVKVNKSGVVTEIDKMPKDASFVDLSKENFES